MANIRYTGRSDARILDARDLKSLGVEDFRKTTFPRKQSVEVSDEVAQALTSSKALSREFELVEEDSEDNTEDEEADGPSILTQKETAKKTGSGGSSSSTGTSGTSGTASTASATGTGGATGGSRRGARGASTRGAS